MTNNKMSIRDKNQYWKVVKLCLVEMWSEKSKEANQKVKQLRKILEPPERKNEQFADLHYHEDPFNMAFYLHFQRDPTQEDYDKYSDQFDSIDEKVYLFLP